MHLEDYKVYSKRNASIGKALALSAAPTKIHYLLRGRNAWHSTWVQHYYPGCMATSNHDVESDAEKRRENGSVWSITELPALAVASDAGTLVITQLNQRTPLVGYSPEAISAHPPQGTLLMEGARNRYLISGTPLAHIALSFESGSRFWKRKPPPQDSVILLYLPNPKIKLEPLTDQLFRRRSQPSGGRQNSICWSVLPGDVDSSAVLNLASNFQEAAPSQIGL